MENTTGDRSEFSADLNLEQSSLLHSALAVTLTTWVIQYAKERMYIHAMIATAKDVSILAATMFVNCL